MPSWTVRCTYGPGALGKRDTALPAHEDYLRARSHEIRFAGPMFADDGATRTGLWLMIEAADRAAAERFIAGEAFNRAGMFGDVEIKRFLDTEAAAPRQTRIVADPKRVMFVCECVDGSDGSATREGAAETGANDARTVAGRLIVRGASVSDDASRRLGTVAIVEVEGRAGAEAFVAADLRAGAGACREARIDRWRFGKSVV